MSFSGWDAFTQIRSVGSGTFGQVWLVEVCPYHSRSRSRHPHTHQTPQGNVSNGGPEGRYVVKRVHVSTLNEKELRDAIAEVQILNLLDHPNIIRYYGHFVDTDGYLNMVMEYAERGDLESLIADHKERGEFLSEERIVFLAFQLLQALKYVSSINILHRDIKPANILITADDRLKLADFGISKRLVETMHARTVVGTPYYFAPEICSDEPYDFASDVWAMGCVIYELAALRRAFEGGNLLAIVHNISSGKYPPLPPQYSPALNNMVRRMLAPKAKDRATVGQLINDYFIMEGEALVCKTPLADAAIPTKMTKNYNKWSERLHRVSYQRKMKENRQASASEPAAAATAAAAAAPAPAPKRVKKKRKPKAYVPEVQIFLPDRGRNCLLLPERPAAADAPADAGTADPLDDTYFEEGCARPFIPVAVPVAEEDYELDFEAYEGSEGDDDTVRCEPGASDDLSSFDSEPSKNFHAVLAAHRINQDTNLLVQDFHRRFRASMDFSTS
eukprot:TRINITY_DN11868_c0_g2_i4.p1 TRINITY_DN11868_c0_g2~~TRINITY_DN11868_c0_g2_i4.p1  ORF type:complete len:503 (+),score=115.34 TRINITY_DN11868_c0_g2_i4:86-1594(+)